MLHALGATACVHCSFVACRGNAAAAGPAAAAVLTAGAKLSRGPRLKPKKLSGSWKAFDLTAVPIDETDPSTGEFPEKAVTLRILT